MATIDSHAVEAARSVLLELFELLKEHRESVVVVGGWVPVLLPSKRITEHVGTTDVDLLLDPCRALRQEAGTIGSRLRSAGYVKGRERFQYLRSVQTEIGPVDVRVDLLTPEPEGNPPGDYFENILGVEALKIRGGDLAVEGVFQTEMGGNLPDGRSVRVLLQVASSVPFLVLKGLALFDRRERKDAYDIYHRIKNYQGDIGDLANEFGPYIEHEVVKESLMRLTACFSSLKSEGPRFVADFLDAANSEERQYLQRDAYELVNALLKILGVAESDT